MRNFGIKIQIAHCLKYDFFSKKCEQRESYQSYHLRPLR